jgi:hypothetical protein
MAKTQILEYTIHLRDKALADLLIADLASLTSTARTGGCISYPGGAKLGIYRAPFNAGPPEGGASVEFSVLQGTYETLGRLPLVEAGGIIPNDGPGYITSQWFTPSNTFPRDVKTFERDESWWIGGVTRFHWAGQVAYAPSLPAPTPASGAIEPTQPAPMPVRYLLSSGQLMQGTSSVSTAGETSASLGLTSARVASRLGGGFGWCMKTDSATTQEIAYNHQGSPRGRWERFYFRAPVAPNVQTGLWRGQNAAVAGQGYGIALTPALQIAFLDFSTGSTSTLLGTFGQLEAGRWYKFDTIFDVDDPGNLVYCEIFLDGVSICSASKASGGVVRQHSRSNIGESVSNTTSALFHFDSYVIADPPATRSRGVAEWGAGTGYVTGDIVRVGADGNGTWAPRWIALQASTGRTPGAEDTPGSETWSYWRRLTDPIDFQMGSHLVRVAPTAFASDHGAWTGDVRMLKQRGDGTLRSALTSTTSGAIASVEVDLERDVEGITGALGWICAQVTALNARGGVANGTLGYQLGSASAPVMTAITQGATLEWDAVLYSPSGLDEPITGETIELRHAHAADTTSCSLASLCAIVEVIGRFGPEDDPVVDPFGSGASSGSGSSVGSSTEPESPADDRYPNGLHNGQYPRSPWFLDKGALGPIIVKGGTYVGNNLGTTLSFPVPPAFLFVRNAGAGAASQTIYFPTVYDGHNGFAQGASISLITSLEQDDDFVDSDPDADQQMSFDVHIAGSNAAINANGVTYQYIAFCDPAARYARSGVFTGNDLVAPFVHAIDDPEFLPEILLAWEENLSTTSTATLNMQGPGHAAGSVSLLTASTAIASALTTIEGQFTVGGNWVSTTFGQYPYLGFRRHDGNNHEDEDKVMFLGTYTGDGAASRTINIGTTGLRPLYCIVQSLGAASIWRDPSHTTNTSGTFGSSGTTTTGLTAGGIDQFTVGSSLNSNGVVYNFWGVYADATAGNGGWGTNGTFAPVPADSPFPSDWSEPEDIPFEGASSSGAGAPPPEQPDLDEDTPLPNTVLFCLDYSQRICNRALGRIGVSKQIGNLATDTTEQAVVARLHLKDDVEATLRLFPWAFATAYANLVLHSGDDSDPVNEDWQYAYLAPVDLVFARRVAPQSGRRRKYDPVPIVFRLGLDEGDGALLYCNERASDDVPLQLEYTKRVGCPSYFGDALFREALVWKVASSFAAALAKDAAKAEFCLRAWEAFRSKAETAAANEQQPEQGTSSGDASWISGRDDADWIRSRE